MDIKQGLRALRQAAARCQSTDDTATLAAWQCGQRVLGDPQRFQAAVQGALAEAQVRRQLLARAAEAGVQLGQRDAVAARRRGWYGALLHRRRQQLLDANHAVIGKQAGPFQHVAQFADIARPWALLQLRQGIGVYRQRALARARSAQE